MDNGKVVVVMWDGDPDCRTCALRDAGWFVLLVSEDGGGAVRLIEAERPLAVIIDLATRPTHGWAVARALRAHPALRLTPLLMLGEPDAEAGADGRLPEAEPSAG